MPCMAWSAWPGSPGIVEGGLLCNESAGGGAVVSTTGGAGADAEVRVAIEEHHKEGETP